MIQQLLIGVGLIAGCVACLTNPFWGLITLMGVNMVQPGELYSVYNALHTERMVALLAIIMLFAKGGRFVFHRVSKWILYFYGACLVSIPTAFWISNSITSVTDFGKTIVIHLLYVALVTTRKRMFLVLVLFSTLVGYLCVTSMILYFQGTFVYAMSVDRIQGLTNTSNTPDALALTICTALPIMYLFTRKPCSTKLRLYMWGLIALSLWTMLLTGARGPFLSFLLITGLAILISKRRLILMPTVLVAFVLLWAALPAQYQKRYLTLSNGTATDTASYTNRLLSWQGGWHMFLHNPLTGIGVGDYTFANGSGLYYPGGGQVYINAHSLYFKILGELGLVGVITFAGFVTVLIRTNNAIRRQLKVLDDRSAEGRAEAVPDWMRLLPTACTLSVIALLYTGYAYHDVYRTTWYFLAAVSAALEILVQKELAASEDAVPEPAAERAALPAGAKPWEAMA